MLLHYEYKFRNETILSVHATEEMQLIFKCRRCDIVLKAKIHLKPFARRKEITMKQTGVPSPKSKKNKLFERRKITS